MHWRIVNNAWEYSAYFSCIDKAGQEIVKYTQEDLPAWISQKGLKGTACQGPETYIQGGMAAMNAEEQDKHLLAELEESHELNRAGLIRLLKYADPERLFAAADRVRKKYVGEEVHLRGLIEISSFCSKTCLYCGLRAENKGLQRFRMSRAEILDCARRAAGLGLKTIVLQSGEDKSYPLAELCEIIREIKKLDVAITLSAGEFSKAEYAALKEAGADRYLLRIETSNKQLYESVHPGMSYENRVRCLYDIKELDFEVGTGCLIGLPGQTPEMLADDLLFFKTLGPDMIGLGPFIPCEGTPLAGAAGGDVETVLRMMALVRLLLPWVNMPATTALGVKDTEGHRKGLRCGANVIMPNMGLNEYKKLYTIYPGKGQGLGSQDPLERVKALILAEGRRIGLSYGGRQHGRGNLR